MNNKVSIITGCNSGIGKVTAIELAKLGYEILMLVRDCEKSRMAYKEIKKESKSELVSLFFVDLSSVESINEVVISISKAYPKIDLLINNAGLFKRKEEHSIDGFEMTIAVNYIAVFLLTNLLLPLIKKADSPRIINLSSELYKRGKIHLDNQFSEKRFNGDKSYANSKLLVVIFTKELSKRLNDTDITVNCVHPGVIGTDVFREYPKWFARLMNLIIAKPTEGAKPTIYLSTSNEVNGITGKYYYKTKQKETNETANDIELSEKIWNKTEMLLKRN